jgi:phosphomannomutase
MADRDRTLGELVQELTQEFGPHFYGRVDLEIARDVAQRIVRLVGQKKIKRIAGLKVTSVDDLDGAKMRFGDSAWLLVRASGTENVLRLYAEAPTAEQVEALLAEIETFSRKQS